LHTPPMDAWNTHSAIIAFRQPLQIPSLFFSAVAIDLIIVGDA